LNVKRISSSNTYTVVGFRIHHTRIRQKVFEKKKKKKKLPYLTAPTLVTAIF
jgi:hypothetical protein